jgi:chemotaxis signal transduction protein
MTALDERPDAWYLAIEAAGVAFGVPLRASRGILPARPIERLPGVPAPALGAVEGLRVIDLSLALGLGPTRVERWSAIVVLDERASGSATPVGLLASVRGIAELEPGSILAPPTAARGLLLGVAQLGADPLWLLDVPRVAAATGDALATRWRALCGSPAVVPQGALGTRWASA